MACGVKFGTANAAKAGRPSNLAGVRRELELPFACASHLVIFNKIALLAASGIRCPRRAWLLHLIGYFGLLSPLSGP